MTKTKYKNKKPLTLQLPKALTPTQEVFINAIKTQDMVVVTGPAGTGKTFLATAYAAYYYSIGKVSKIILTRPVVPVGKSIGYFPGDLNEKMLPWTAPFISVLEKFLSKGEVECMIKNGKIDIVPFEVIRGRTFDNAFIILDEAQNTTRSEIKAFVTRIGEYSKVVVNGDLEQSDLDDTQTNGLTEICNLLKKKRNKNLASKVSHIHFTFKDIVRSELCRLWVKAFD